jgi:hypothetical protein
MKLKFNSINPYWLVLNSLEISIGIRKLFNEELSLFYWESTGRHISYMSFNSSRPHLSALYTPDLIFKIKSTYPYWHPY